jgi:hypothetical protein
MADENKIKIINEKSTKDLICSFAGEREEKKRKREKETERDR